MKRFLTGALLTLTLIAGFFLREIDYRIFDVLILTAAIICSVEFNNALGDRTSKSQKILSIAFTPIVFLVAIFIKKSLFTVIFVYAFITLIFSAMQESSKAIDKIANYLLSLFYPTIPILFLTLINQMGAFSLFALVITFATTSATDIYAYFVGSKLKGKKLCEKISPNKTVSGAIGGFVGGVITGVLVYYAFKLFGASPFEGAGEVIALIFVLISSMLSSIVTQIGDLFESSIKRSLEIKDMGNLLPGHGGMLDRIDGLMFNAMAVYLCYALLV
jgi:phosphatidate cytidylyltransferase